MTFSKPFSVESKKDIDRVGMFRVEADPCMGILEGTYNWRQINGVCSLRLSPDKGWKVVPNSVLTRMILSDKSIFSTWPKLYEYTQEIDMSSLRSKSEWVNKKFK